MLWFCKMTTYSLGEVSVEKQSVFFVGREVRNLAIIIPWSPFCSNISPFFAFSYSPKQGTGPNEYIGNTRFRNLVRQVLMKSCCIVVDDNNEPALEKKTANRTSSSPEFRVILARQIVQTIASRGGRFWSEKKAQERPRFLLEAVELPRAVL